MHTFIHVYAMLALSAYLWLKALPTITFAVVGFKTSSAYFTSMFREDDD
jgi:hypothetical protein